MDKKNLYECNICEKKFRQKSDLDRHNNKKNKCKKDDIKIDGKKIHKCIFCGKIFNQKCNYLVHINRKNKCIKEDNKEENIKENIKKDVIKDDNNKENKIIEDKIIGIKKEDMLSMINELKEKLVEQNNKLVEQEKEINNLKKNKSYKNKTKNINNGLINNTVNNNIVYVNHGKEDLSKLIKEEIKEIINSGLNCITKSVIMTHCNDRLPEYKNIRYSDTKSSYCDIIENKEWKKTNFEIIIEELINKHYLEVSDMCKENKELFESSFKEKLIEDHLEEYKRYSSYETEDIYPESWNTMMKKEKLKETRKILNRNKNKIKSEIINQTLKEKTKMIE